LTLFFSMRAELLRLVDMIHREKDIDKEAVFLGLEAAIRSAIIKKWGDREEVSVSIDRETGEITATVGDQELDQRQLQEQLGRLAAQTGKQVLFQKIREAAREVIYREFVGKIGTLVSGTVQRYEGSTIVVNLQRTEGIIPRSEQVPSERFRVGDRLKALVRDVVRDGSQVRIILSRRDPAFVRALFELEVPEIRDGTIEVINLAREPGQRTKIAVASSDENVDCVGACVGVRGCRVKSIREELFGEKIEIVPWQGSDEMLIVSALKPLRPSDIVSLDLDYDNRRVRVYVTPEQQSVAIGRRGQNVRLASQLLNWDIDIVAVSKEDIERLRTEDVEQGEEIGEVVGTARSVSREEQQESQGPEEAAVQEEEAAEETQAEPAEGSAGEQAVSEAPPEGETEERVPAEPQLQKQAESQEDQSAESESRRPEELVETGAQEPAEGEQKTDADVPTEASQVSGGGQSPDEPDAQQPSASNTASS